jgi:hypothetical protein
LAESHQIIPPLFKADTATVTFSRLPDGKIRVNYAGWEALRASRQGGVTEVPGGPEGAEGWGPLRVTVHRRYA